MAQNIFVRGGAPSPSGGSGVYTKGYGRRPNGTASVSAGGIGGSSSPFLATGGGKGRPDTILNYAKIIMEGDAGSLTRAEFQATAYTPGAFKGIIAGAAKIGEIITVTVGSVSKSVRVYKHNFTSDKQGKWTVTVTAVGEGLSIMKNDPTGNNPQGGGIFYKNGIWAPEETTAKGLLDIIGHQIFRDCKTQPFSAALDHGRGIAKKYFMLMAPSSLQTSGDTPGAPSIFGYKNALYYVSLGHLVDTINSGLTGGRIDISQAKSEMLLPGGIPLVSGDPLRVLIANGTNSDYGSAAGSGVVALIKSILGVPNEIGTSNTDATDMGGDCANIYLEMGALRAAVSNLTGANQDAAAFDETRKKSPGSRLDIEGFLSAIFGMIKEATGGFIDLIVMMDPANPDTTDPIIVNAKGKEIDPGATTYDDISGEGGVREAGVSGAPPQGVQVAAFNGPSPVGEPTSKSKTAPSIGDFNDGKKKLVEAGYADPSVLSGVLRKSLADASVGDYTSQASMGYPVGLDLVINGTAGVEFGHAIAISSLSGTDFGKNSVFTVTRVEHVVQNQDWTTAITTVCRFAG